MQKFVVNGMDVYIKKNTVILGYGIQLIAFHNYECANKRTINKFGRLVVKQDDLSIFKAMEMAREYGVKFMSVSRAVLMEGVEDESNVPR